MKIRSVTNFWCEGVQLPLQLIDGTAMLDRHWSTSRNDWSSLELTSFRIDEEFSCQTNSNQFVDVLDRANEHIENHPILTMNRNQFVQQKQMVWIPCTSEEMTRIDQWYLMSWNWTSTCLDYQRRIQIMSIMLKSRSFVRFSNKWRPALSRASVQGDGPWKTWVKFDFPSPFQSWFQIVIISNRVNIRHVGKTNLIQQKNKFLAFNLFNNPNINASLDWPRIDRINHQKTIIITELKKLPFGWKHSPPWPSFSIKDPIE